VNQGLQNQVVYRVWLVAEDSLGNVQTALSSVTVKTVRTTPPNFEEIVVQYTAPTSVYVEVGIAELKLALDWHTVIHSMLTGRERCLKDIA
jgi:hypothetical protein